MGKKLTKFTFLQNIKFMLFCQKVEIKKGDVLWLPTCGFHRDPKYFENPKKFHSIQYDDTIQPNTYFPFGLGPRNCIASRCALFEAKAVIYYLLKEFRLAPAKKSCIPMKLDSSGFQLSPKNGFWIELIQRN
ncbi:probable cytochrome P450 9f2 [Drosophila subpulchrella]|uniref:probable cytochrome P450 9f2 n=1 Tax=Drosophila subpulchrella TaxID=1486046 RepID=UPI0018A13070|nr:probable cytochrome P450 9f2 [Drosophila subpulchrella]